MGILTQCLSLLEGESFRTYFTVSLYIVPVLVVLSLVLRRGTNVHELSNLPLAGATGPGCFGRYNAKGRFVTNGMEMLGEGYRKARQHLSIYS